VAFEILLREYFEKSTRNREEGTRNREKTVMGTHAEDEFISIPVVASGDSCETPHLPLSFLLKFTLQAHGNLAFC
jgi:hypothetical protein